MARRWFKRHRHGIGWTPVTWQAWLVLAGAMVVLGAAAVALDTVAPDDAWWPVAAFVVLTVTTAAALVWISARTGPSLRWRWGRRPDDDPDEDF